MLWRLWSGRLQPGHCSDAVDASQMHRVLSQTGRAGTRKEHGVAKSREKAVGSFNYLDCPRRSQAPQILIANKCSC